MKHFAHLFAYAALAIELVAEPLRERARDDVGRTARRLADDEADRPVGVGGGGGCSTDERGGQRGPGA